MGNFSSTLGAKISCVQVMSENLGCLWTLRNWMINIGAETVLIVTIGYSLGGCVIDSFIFGSLIQTHT